MGFFLELLLELILEGSYEFAKSDNAPKLFRNFVVFCMASIIIILLWTAIKIREEGMLMAMSLALAAVVGVILYRFFNDLQKRESLRVKARNEDSEG